MTNSQKSHLRRLAHPRKPVVMIGGNGLTQAVLDAIEQAIEHHELIKVKVSAADRRQRDALITQIGACSGAELVQRIGHVAVFYRAHPQQPRIQLPG